MSKQQFKHISIGRDGSIWTVGKEDSTIYRLYGDAGLLGWVPDKHGKAEVVAADDWGNVWCVNGAHEIWRAFDDKWQQLVERGLHWTYTVKRGDGLMAIVRKDFGLKDPQDTAEIARLVKMIVAQNGIKNAAKIKEGEVLNLQL